MPCNNDTKQQLQNTSIWLGNALADKHAVINAIQTTIASAREYRRSHNEQTEQALGDSLDRLDDAIKAHWQELDVRFGELRTAITTLTS